ncbi:Fis family transcriptional regulator [Salinibius halmophilus]|uniref:Fis family transcriptional regulator n=1 Tax=Salinibius halmophilus TaxID=1853216 RepID=UPI000E669DA0|nr:Fis family transcriptional regulator [Salinibius halmophilus]
MRKTDKEIDNQIRVLLTDVCEGLMKDVHGFLWLTHSANYQKFPQSLLVTLVFDDQQAIESFRADTAYDALVERLESGFGSFQVKNVAAHLVFKVEG